MDRPQQTNFDIQPHGHDGHGLANISGFSNARLYDLISAFVLYS